MSKYSTIIKRHIDQSIKSLLTEQQDVVDSLEPTVIEFLNSIKNYHYTDIENSVNRTYVCRLFQKNKPYVKSNSTKIVFNLTGNEMKPIEKIVLSYPIDQQVITAVDDAVDKMFPSAKRRSKDLDSFIEYKI